MPINWNGVDLAQQQADDDLAAGHITYAQYLEEMRAVRAATTTGAPT